VEVVGVRELRNQVAAVLRRASSGERILVTVDGVAVAQLGPLQPDASGLTLQDLAAAGLVNSPRRPRPTTAPAAANPPVDIRLDRVLDDLRGR
jgi:prevent-host-death family protein